MRMETVAAVFGMGADDLTAIIAALSGLITATSFAYVRVVNARVQGVSHRVFRKVRRIEDFLIRAEKLRTGGAVSDPIIGDMVADQRPEADKADELYRQEGKHQ